MHTLTYADFPIAKIAIFADFRNYIHQISALFQNNQRKHKENRTEIKLLTDAKLSPLHG
jgi:hypothetical protein